MTNVSSVSATPLKSPNPSLELVEMVTVVMAFAHGKATAAVSGAGAEQRPSTVKAHPMLPRLLDSTLLPRHRWMLENAAWVMLVRAFVRILHIAVLSGGTVDLERVIAMLLMMEQMRMEHVAVVELEMVSKRAV